ncbi:MAG: long-chain fatty acid--CoA ligase [Pseudomonadota bacterium]
MITDAHKKHWPNLVTLFFEQAEAGKKKPFLWHKQDGKYKALSWRDAATKVAKLAAALEKLNIAPGDRVAIVASNRPEWCISDLAIMAIGAISVPVYTTYTERDYAHVLEDSGAKAVIVSDRKLAKLVLPVAHELNHVHAVITIEQPHITQGLNADIYSWQGLVEDTKASVKTISEKAAKLAREDTACLIYTSGTGGAPRGVKQHHGAILHNCAGAAAVVEEFGIGNDSFLSFLPLSHAYEHTGGQFLPIMLGGQIYYAEGLDKLATNMAEARPTIMVVVPRLFEVLRTKIQRDIAKSGGLKAKLFDRTLALGEKALNRPDEMTLIDRLYNRLLDRLVRKTVRKSFGGRVKALVSGGAPLNAEVGNFFASLGLTMLQGYGQTEAAPIIAVNQRFSNKMDTVGKALPNTEIKFAEDGEILVRGELVMHGYWRDDEATQRAIADGWLHTGDVGEIDADGHIRITDRKKDIIVNDKGDNVSPQRVEGMLALEPEIGQAMVYGDQRPYLVGLLVPDVEWLAEWQRKTGNQGELKDLASDAELIAALDKAVAKINAKLTVTEKVRRFSIAPEAFTIENAQMTPSLKIRRHVISAAYEKQLIALYGAPKQVDKPQDKKSA